MYGIIYKATNSINNKVYIGQTKRKLKVRMKGHYKAASESSNNYFMRALRKYGENNWMWEIIDTGDSPKELNEKETYWISHYKSNNAKYGYNSTSGGTNGYIFNDEIKRKLSEMFKGRKHSKETKIKISNGNKNKIVSNESRIKMSKSHIGKTLTREHKDKIGKAVSGDKNGNYGKQFTEEHRQKIGEASKGRKHTEETKTILRKKCSGANNGMSRKILCITNGKTYDSMSIASKELDINVKLIRIVCQGKRKKTKGHEFKYLD